MRVADLIVSALRKARIEHIFLVSGGGAIFLNDAVAKSGISYIACHHEQAAAMAAEAYARVRNAYGAVMVTSGPGGTNALTGVCGAWTDSAPVIVISGQSFLKQTIGETKVRTMGVQEINIVDIVSPITKFAVMLDDPKMALWNVQKALHIAKHGRPGPVWIDVPADIQNAEVDEVAIFKAPPEKSEFGLQEVIDLLKSAQRPLLHVGQGVRIAKGLEEFHRFVATSRIPVLTARNGNDLIDSEHECYIGRPGTFAQRGANFAVQSCDVYLAVGTRLGLAQTGYNAKDYARNAKIIHVDIDQAELDKNTVPVHLKVRADAKDFFWGLNNYVKAWSDWSQWLQRCKSLQAKYPPVTDDQRNDVEVNSYAFIERLSELASPDDVIVTDVGFAYQNTNQVWKVKSGQRLITNGGTAAMGCGLPYAIGAAVGSGRRVLAIIGDGGLMFNLQELATLAHHKLNVKIFLLNNDGYLTMKQSQENGFGREMGSGRKSLSFPDFALIARAFGIGYDRLKTHGEMNYVFRDVLDYRAGPVLCEVMMDPTQNQIPKSINRRMPDGSLKPTSIEDQWPYLPRGEIEENLCEP